MSLEELRAQAETEEEVATGVEEPEAQDEPEAEEPEAEEGSSEQEEGDETEEAETSEEFELELGGEPEPDQQKPSPEDALVYKLTKQKQKTREYKTELEELKEELKALKEGRTQPQAQSRQQPAQNYPPVPLLYENGIDTPEQYQKAYQKWVADCKAIDKRNAEADQQKSEYKRQMEELTHNLARRVGKFATEHKMGTDYVVSAVERARQEVEDATGIEGSLAYMLDAVGEGSEKAAIWIGTSKGAKDLERIKQLLGEDKTGLKAIAHLTRIASRQPATRRTSKAPAPDRPIKGDGSSASAKSLQDKYDKTSNPNEMMRLRKKARELGVKLT